jgi:Protein of unknown function (DUF2750)
MAMTKNEIADLYKESTAARYQIFCDRVIEQDAIWYARLEEGAPITVKQGKDEFLPVWINAETAKVALADTWPNAECRSITINDWLGKLLGFEEDCLGLAVLLSSDGTAYRISANEMRKDLIRKMSETLFSQLNEPIDDVNCIREWNKLLRKASKAGPKGNIPG